MFEDKPLSKADENMFRKPGTTGSVTEHPIPTVLVIEPQIVSDSGTQQPENNLTFADTETVNSVTRRMSAIEEKLKTSRKMDREERTQLQNQYLEAQAELESLRSSAEVLDMNFQLPHHEPTLDELKENRSRMEVTLDRVEKRASKHATNPDSEDARRYASDLVRAQEQYRIANDQLNNAIRDRDSQTDSVSEEAVQPETHLSTNQNLPVVIRSVDNSGVDVLELDLMRARKMQEKFADDPQSLMKWINAEKIILQEIEEVQSGVTRTRPNERTSTETVTLTESVPVTVNPDTSTNRRSRLSRYAYNMGEGVANVIKYIRRRRSQPTHIPVRQEA